MRNPTRRSMLTGIGSVPMLGWMPFDADLGAEDRSTVPFLEDAAESGAEARSEVGSDPGSQFAMDVPDNVTEPFLLAYGAAPVYMGEWQDADRDVMIEEVLRLDPDMISNQHLFGRLPPFDGGVGRRTRAGGMLTHRYGSSASGGIHPITPVETVDDWYDDQPDDERWYHPDGTPVTSVAELAGVGIDGEPWQPPAGPGDAPDAIFPSVFAEGTLKYFTQRGREISQMGFTQLWVDHISFGTSSGLDCSLWADVTFREYLESLPDSTLAEYGIDDVDGFDMRSYLQTNDLMPDDVEVPAVDPVYRERRKLQHRTAKRLFDRFFEDAREDLPAEIEAAGSTNLGVQFGLQSHVLRPASVYLSDVFDEILLETSPTIPPEELSDVSIKIARASGRFEKAVRVFHTIWHEQPEAEGFDSTEYYPTLLEFHVAQSYAHGAVHQIQLTSGPDESYDWRIDTWMREDGTIGDRLHRFVDFLRSHRRFLSNGREQHRTAIVVSLPTLLWEDAPEWGTPRSHRNAVHGTGRLLREAQLPFDVVILDDPELWAAPEQTAALQTYDQVVLPSVECVSDDHVAALEEALAAGTSVLVAGGAPTRSAAFEPREDLQATLESASNATVVDDDVSADGNGVGAQAVRDQLAAFEPGVELDSDARISLTRMAVSDGTERETGAADDGGSGADSDTAEFVVVHLLNYAYDRDTDAMRSREAVKVTVRDLPFSPAAASYYTVDGSTALEIDGDADEVSVTVPTLDVWGFLVFAESDAALRPATDEAAARTTINEAREAVETAVTDDREELLEAASATLHNAEQAFAFEQYDVAKDRATAAIDWADRAYRTPVIGIDQAHNQPSHPDFEWDDGGGSFAAFADAFPEYEVRPVPEWNHETLEELDLLFVPPALGDALYEFTETELDAAESFVTNGGGLVVEGFAGMPEDISELTSVYGFNFDRAEIGRPEGERIEAAIEPSRLTWMFTGSRPRTVLTDIGDAHVWARLPEDTGAWLNRTHGPVHDREPDDEDAAGAPVGVAVSHGEGFVVGAGYLLVSQVEFGSDEWALVANLVALQGLLSRTSGDVTGDESDDGVIDENGGHADDEDDGEATDDDERIENEDTETDTESPGFGIGAGIAGVGGAAYLLRKRLSDEDRE